MQFLNLYEKLLYHYSIEKILISKVYPIPLKLNLDFIQNFSDIESNTALLSYANIVYPTAQSLSPQESR